MNIIMAFDKSFQVAFKRVTILQSHLQHKRDVFSLDSLTSFLCFLCFYFLVSQMSKMKMASHSSVGIFIIITNNVECF